jgi:hypothetical protein
VRAAGKIKNNEIDASKVSDLARRAVHAWRRSNRAQAAVVVLPRRMQVSLYSQDEIG